MNNNEILTGNDSFAVPYYEIPYDKFFQFGMSVDCVVFGYHDSKLKVLVIKRGASPYKGSWALPGDLVYPNENIEDAAVRVLKDLTGISNLFLQQTKVYGNVNRHPVARVITAGFYALIDISKHDPHASAWAEGVYWKDISTLPSLAFDHTEIARDALQLLREKIRREPIGFNLLPAKFTLGELQELYEGLLDLEFDKANFRKKILSLNILEDTKELQRDVPHRPGKLYQFNETKQHGQPEKNFAFDL